MDKKATYRGLSFNWLIAMSMAFSLIAFPGLVHTTEASRPQPQRIEVVTSGQDDTECRVITFQIAASDFSSDASPRARGYEENTQLVYQRSVKVLLDTISERTNSYSTPVFSRIVRVINSLSDDNPPPIPG